MSAAAVPADPGTDDEAFFQLGFDGVPGYGAALEADELLVRVSALSRYQETLHAPGTGVVQQVCPNSSLATLHCVQGLKIE